MYKIFAYIRQSSIEQVRYGYNLEEQERQIRNYCDINYKNNYELSLYIDAGKSGTNMKRPELQKLLRDSRLLKPDLVVFHNIDRLSRELIDLWSMIKFFNEYNVKLASVYGSIDLTTAYGKGNLLNEGLSAMIESMKISDRTIRALKEAVRQGKYPFPKAPLGYSIIDKRLVLSDNANEIEAVEYIFNNSALNKFSNWKLKNDLKTMFNINVSEDRIRRIITNKIYTGSIIYRDIEVDNYCKPLISKDVFDRANKAKNISKRNNRKVDYFFRRVCYCKECDSYMIHTCGKSHTKKIYAYYKCPKCKRMASQVKIVDYLLTDLNRLSKKFFDEKNGKLDLELKLNNLKKRKKKLLNKQISEPINTDDFYSIYKNLEDKIESIENQLVEIKTEFISYKKLSTPIKREICSKYIKVIEISFNPKTYKAKIIENK